MSADGLRERLIELQGDSSERKFANRLGISQGAYRALLGGGKPNLDTLLLITERSGVEIKWLATGQGPKFAVAPVISDGHSIELSHIAQADALIGDAFAMVPRLDVAASAGNGAIADQEDIVDLVAFRADWLQRRGINPQAARALTVRGDSMEPTIRSGDMLLVDTSRQRVDDNGIYIVVSNGFVQVKRIHPRQNGAVVLISDNTLYPSEEIPASEAADFRVAGRVMWFGRSI